MKWYAYDFMGQKRAEKLLPILQRDIRHSTSREEALEQIAGAVAHGFIPASKVANILMLPLATVEAAANEHGT